MLMRREKLGLQKAFVDADIFGMLITVIEKAIVSTVKLLRNRVDFWRDVMAFINMSEKAAQFCLKLVFFI